MERKKIRLTDVFLFIKKYNESSIAIYSGQTAFFIMLSFFPFMLFFFTLLNLTPFTEADFLAWAEAIIPASLQGAMQTITSDIFSGNTSGRISVTVITAIWLSSKAFVSIQKGLNVMYEIKETRNYLFLRFYSVLYSVVFAVLLLIILALMVFGKQLNTRFFPEWGWLAELLHVRFWICIPVLFFFFWLVYIFCPNKKRIEKQKGIKNQIPGAVFASGGWIIFSWLFSIYVDKYNNYASFYGTMTTIALIMVWLYGCMYVLFLGGLINSAREQRLQR